MKKKKNSKAMRKAENLQIKNSKLNYSFRLNNNGLTTIFYGKREVANLRLINTLIIDDYLFIETYSKEWCLFSKGRHTFGSCLRFKDSFFVREHFYRFVKILYFDESMLLKELVCSAWLKKRLNGLDVFSFKVDDDNFIIMKSVNKDKLQMKQVYEPNDEVIICKDDLSNVDCAYLSVDSYKGHFKMLGVPTKRMYFCAANNLPYYQGFWDRIFNLSIEIRYLFSW